jgi:preprotein translocase subunit SecB
MKLSRLELQNYFVTALSLTANQNLDSQKERAACGSHLQVEPTLRADERDNRHWQVTLKATYRPGPDVNATYHFAIEIVGLFQVAQEVAEEKIQWLVETNATSVLYSTAREILRSAMAAGPYPPLLLPAASFYEPKAQGTETAEIPAGKP